MSSPPLPRNGCFDRAPLRDAYDSLQFGHRIVNTATKDCQYSKTTVDTRCDGCTWKAVE